MKLIDLLLKIDPSIFVWVTADENGESPAVFACEVGQIKAREADLYNVRTLYPDSYPCVSRKGITIIVEKK